MIFDGHDLNQWVRVKHERRLAPKITDSTVSMPGRPGSVLMRTQMKPLEIPAEIRLKLAPCTSEDAAKVWRRLAGILITPDERKLVLPESPDLYYMAKVTDAGEFDTLWYTGSCEIKFTAYDPIAYGKTRSATVSSGSSTLEVGGTYETYPVFDLKATSTTRVRVTNEDTGEYVLMVTNPSTNATIKVDMGAQMLRMNTNLQKIYIGSDYFALKPGENHINIIGASGTVTWEERWL